jgi:hypothetical protein
LSAYSVVNAVGEKAATAILEREGGAASHADQLTPVFRCCDLQAPGTSNKLPSSRSSSNG